MGKPTRAEWDERLQCRVVSLAYNFRNHKGQVYLLAGNCCDMAGCVALFEGIDPKVTAVETFSGDKVDTVYRKESGKWSALQSNKP